MTVTALALVNRDADCQRRPWSPEMRLWGAVLVDALETLRLGRTAAQARAAKAWITSDVTAFGSFEHVCAALGLDAAAVRTRVLRGRVGRVRLGAVGRAPAAGHGEGRRGR
jgi:hypothetical protein